MPPSSTQWSGPGVGGSARHSTPNAGQALIVVSWPSTVGIRWIGTSLCTVNGGGVREPLEGTVISTKISKKLDAGKSPGDRATVRTSPVEARVALCATSIGPVRLWPVRAIVVICVAITSRPASTCGSPCVIVTLPWTGMTSVPRRLTTVTAPVTPTAFEPADGSAACTGLANVKSPTVRKEAANPKTRSDRGTKRLCTKNDAPFTPPGAHPHQRNAAMSLLCG